MAVGQPTIRCVVEIHVLAVHHTHAAKTLAKVTRFPLSVQDDFVTAVHVPDGKGPEPVRHHLICQRAGPVHSCFGINVGGKIGKGRSHHAFVHEVHRDVIFQSPELMLQSEHAPATVWVSEWVGLLAPHPSVNTEGRGFVCVSARHRVEGPHLRNLTLVRDGLALAPVQV